MPPDTDQSLANLRLERDAIILYDALARIEKDPKRASAFERIAGNERRHASIWADKLRERGVDVPPEPTRPRPRVATIVEAGTRGPGAGSRGAGATGWRAGAGRDATARLARTECRGRPR